jgi:cytochrome P450
LQISVLPFPVSGLISTCLYCCSTGQHWATHRKLLTPAFHFKVLESFVDVFNRNGKILVEKLSSHVNGPEFDVTPYMILCALDNISGEFRVSTLNKTEI